MPARRFVELVVLATLAAALTGCSYTSTYVAPEDGRARVTWVGGEFVAVVPKVEGCEPAAVAAVAASRNSSKSGPHFQGTLQEVMVNWPLLVALVVATLPVSVMVLADTRIESADRAVRAIDLVNATNELARIPESPCALPPPTPAEARP